MKRYLLPVLFLFSGITLYSQTWVWAEQFGGNAYDQGNAIAVDANGNSYVTGTFQDTATFGSFTLISSGDDEVFTAKYDANGNCLWAKKGGCPYPDGSYAIAIDNSGNCYIAGFYNFGTPSFGSFTLPAATWDDIFVVKYNSSGVEQWAVKFGGAQNDYAYGLVSDGANGLYMIGNFQASVTFGTNNLSSSGWGDVVVAKLDASNGSCIWATKGGGSGNDNGKAICLTGSEVYVTGFFRNTATFGTQPTITSAGFEDVFVGKLDANNGSWQWVKKGGSSTNDNGLGIITDGGGGIYAVGFYEGTGTFGTNNMTSAGGQDIFLVKYNSTGGEVYAKSHGGWGNDHCYGLVRDPNGDLVLTGSFEGTATFDANSLNTAGISDIFVAKCSSVNGANIWAVKAGAEDEDKALGIGMDANTEIYATGYFRANCNFGVVATLTSNVFNEGWLGRMTYPLSVEEFGTLSFHVYPVPTQDALHISLQDPGIFEVQVLSVHGALLRSEKISGDHVLDVSDLPAGNYMVRVLGDEQLSGVAKFTKRN